MPELPFDANRIFFRPGDVADRAYQIAEGRVELLTGNTRVAVLGPGEVFGEMSLIEERPHRMTARALTPGSCSTLTRAEFEELLFTDPARCREYLKSLFERLRVLAAQVAVDTKAGSRPGDSHPVALPADEPAAPLAHRVVLYPLTRRAAQTLPEDGLLLTRFPLRIGRTPEPGEPEGMDLNDLWLFDQKPFNVSRNHCAIDLDADGHVVVRDRGSHTGCQVNEAVIGAKTRARETRLHPGQNVLVLGSLASPYQFRIAIDEPA